MRNMLTLALGLPAVVVSACATVPVVESEGTQAAATVSLPLGTTTTEAFHPLNCDGRIDYHPVPAFPAPNYTKYTLDSINKTVESVPENWPVNNADRNALLPNISTEIRIHDFNASASGGPFGSGSIGRRRITIDFMKYRSEPVKDNSGSTFLYSRVGAGLRTVITLVKWDASASSGGLIPIALSAKTGKTEGYITAEVIGMNAADITLAMPFTSDISEQSIQSIIEAMAVVRSKLHETNTNLEPQFIARMDCVEPS